MTTARLLAEELPSRSVGDEQNPNHGDNRREADMKPQESEPESVVVVSHCQLVLMMERGLSCEETYPTFYTS